jgi:hypothetical protein
LTERVGRYLTNMSLRFQRNWTLTWLTHDSKTI